MFLSEPDDDSLSILYAVPTSSEDRTRPFVRVNFIATVDGRVTGRNGRSSSINNPADKRVFDFLRSLADTVLVGAGTIRHEGYGRLEAGAGGGAPDLVAVSNSGAMPDSVLTSPTRDDGVPRGEAILATHAAAPRDHEVIRLVCGEERVDLRRLLDLLFERGARSVLCEGGPHLLTSLLEAGLVDQLAVTTAPTLVGSSGGELLMTTAPLAVDLTWVGGAVIAGTTFALWDVASNA